VRGRVVIAANAAWNLVNFRSGVIRALIADGYEVVAVAPPDGHVFQLQELGCRFAPLHIESGGMNPGRDALLLFQFLALMWRERPAAFLGYTVKPNIYGSIAARLSGVSIINNVSGLGAVFINQSWLTHIVRLLYRIAFSGSSKVFFQNKDDMHLFLLDRLVTSEVADLLPGSGVDLDRFEPSPLPGPDIDGSISFLHISRMLWDKGVGDFVKAARIARRQVPGAKFFLLGLLDVANPSAISRAQMNEWVQEGVIQYLGDVPDVRAHIAAADCVVLASYREGTPRVLLEAAAMGRPIVTTDAVGCRNVVENGVTGYLCQTGNAEDLAEKLISICTLSPQQRTTMGALGREKMICEYDERIVVEKYLAALGAIAWKRNRFVARP
jgi:glycosyltransferase involved in cell wall biosynthesis